MKKKVKKIEVIQEVPKIETKKTIITVTDRNAIADLEKQGFAVAEVQSAIKGLREKTWILRKE